MTRRKDPVDLVVKPFTDDDDKVFEEWYGKIPAKDLIPMFEHTHSVETIWAKANRMGLSESVPIWSDGEENLLDKATELGMSYAQIAAVAPNIQDCRHFSIPSITQHKYRQREAAKRSLDKECQV